MRPICASFLCCALLVGTCARSQAQVPARPVASGLAVGETVEPWRPIHVAGPDQGTTACPVCTYLDKPAVLVFTSDGQNAQALAQRVEALVGANGPKNLKGFVVVLDSTPEKLAQLAARAGVTRSALCYPDPSTRDDDLRAYKINTAAANTILVYKNYEVTARFVNLSANDFRLVEAAVAKLLH